MTHTNKEVEQAPWPKNIEDIFMLFEVDQKQKTNPNMKKCLKILHMLQSTNNWFNFEQLNSAINTIKLASPMKKKNAANTGVTAKKLSVDHFPGLLNSTDYEIVSKYLERIYLNNKLEVTKLTINLVGACILSVRWNFELEEMRSINYIEPYPVPTNAKHSVPFQNCATESWKR